MGGEQMIGIDRLMVCLNDRAIVRIGRSSRHSGIIKAITERGIVVRTADSTQFVKWENVIEIENKEEVEVRHQEKLKAARAEWIRKEQNKNTKYASSKAEFDTLIDEMIAELGRVKR
jgi:hypothetical protein